MRSAGSPRSPAGSGGRTGRLTAHRAPAGAPLAGPAPRRPAPAPRAGPRPAMTPPMPAGPLELETPHGPARAHVQPALRPRGALILGHGAGGGVSAPDLLAVTRVALEERLSVALVEQPYVVAGRRSAAPAAQLDAAWTAVVAQLGEGPLAGPRPRAGG